MSSIKQIGNTIPRLCRKMTWLKLILATFSHEMRHTGVESLVRAYTIYLFCSALVPQVNLCFRFTVFWVCVCFPVTPFVILKATRSYNTVFVSDDDYIKVHSNFTARNIIVDHQVGVNDILKLTYFTPYCRIYCWDDFLAFVMLSQLLRTKFVPQGHCYRVLKVSHWKVPFFLVLTFVHGV